MREERKEGWGNIEKEEVGIELLRSLGTWCKCPDSFLVGNVLILLWMVSDALFRGTGPVFRPQVL